MTIEFRPNEELKFPEVWDNTMRTALACPHKFYWEFMQQLGPLRPSVHLHFGACFAKGLEVARVAFYQHGVSQEEAMVLGIQAATLMWGDFESLDAVKTGDTLILALESYGRNYPFRTDVIQPHMRPDGKPSVEWSFSFPLPVAHPDTNEPLIYAGKFDLLGEMNGTLWVVDEKTTKQLGGAWAKQWKLNSQFSGYCWAAREYGKPVQGAIIRGTAILKRDIKHAEAIVYRPQWLIDTWYAQLCHDLEQAKKYYATGYWPYNFGAICSSYSGCPYMDLCDSPHPERWIEGKYARRVWDPLHKEGEK